MNTSAPCEHFTEASLRSPTANSRISKEECSQCFQSWDSDDGLDICLTCFNTSCPSTHSKLHSQLHQHFTFLQLKRISIKKDESSPPPLKKLAIIPNDDSNDYEIRSTVKCMACNRSDITVETEKIQMVVNSILNATSPKTQEEMKSWELEITSCSHTENLQQQQQQQQLPESNSTSPLKPCCSTCGLETNVWLCLVCGHVGCGRAQVGGQVGHGHALLHYETTHHSVVAKLGTITPEGQADVFCYTCGEERVDPLLPHHLLHLGIPIESQQKTELSLLEMQLKQNIEFSMVTKDGEALTPLTGPWFTGLKNLGNSCYLNVTFQLLNQLALFRELHQSDHFLKCLNPPLTCHACQWIKLAKGMAMYEQNAVAPLYLKALICQHHSEFRSMKQQDVSEFLSFLFQYFETLRPKELPDLASLFRYQSVQKLQCHQCHGVSFSETSSELLNLHLPQEALIKALNESTTITTNQVEKKENHETGKENPSQPTLTELNAFQCFKDTVQETVEFQCPHCCSQQKGVKITGFSTFPEYLVIVTQRFVYDGWVPKKSEILLTWPDVVDFDEFRLKKEEGGMVLDKPEVIQLVSFGFEKEKALKALQHCQFNVEMALNELMDHPEKFESTPFSSSSSSSSSTSAKVVVIDQEQVSMLTSMGFSKQAAEKALNQCQGSIEASIEWLFQHPDADFTPEETQENVIPSTSVTSSKEINSSTSSQFKLIGFINHKGSSMHCGHYICHFLDDQQRWVLYNDEKVVLASDEAETLRKLAYIYILKRID